MAFHQTSMFEVECIGMKKALSWVLNQGNNKTPVETDSMLTVEAINGQRKNMLEVGHVIDQCKSIFFLTPDVKIRFVRRQVNKIAHHLTRFCLVLLMA